MLDLVNLPKDAGCYIFKEKNGDILYVGKAKNLKKRVSSYFQKKNLDTKNMNLIERTSSIDYIVTLNEIEALILENNLIKKYQPRYNIRLKDSKSYAYIQITDEDFPRVVVARGKTGKGMYYGPFVSAIERDYILQFLKKTFSFRSCKKMPKKTCLRYHIKLCAAPCIGNISIDDYKKKIEKVKLVLSGHIDELIKKMQNEMKGHSEKLEFENAILVRNQITALKSLCERQNMQRQKKYNEDILNFEVKNNKVYLMIFNIYKGTLVNKSDFVFGYNDDFFEEFLIQYYSENQIPKELIIPCNISDAVISFLQSTKKEIVKVTKPVRGEKKQLLDLVAKNIEINFFAKENKVKSLKKSLNLHENPYVIECFDISHLSGHYTVGSMVQFRNGTPDKNNYRRFKIRTINGVDDFGAIAEVVRRRYTRLIKEDSNFPNLIIIDGGRGQLNFALHELEKLNLKIPIVSIAKKLEEIYIPGKDHPLSLSKNDKALKFIQEIRDEAHRFAIKYNRLLRKKEMIS